MLLTHSHPEHIGPLKGLSQTTGATITAHRADTRHRNTVGDHWLHYPGQRLLLPTNPRGIDHLGHVAGPRPQLSPAGTIPRHQLRGYRASAERLVGLSFEPALVGHGRPVLEAGTALLKEILNH